MHQVEGADPSLPLSTGGTPLSVHAHTGASPVQGHSDDYGTKACDTREEVDRAGEEKDRNILSTCTNTRREVVKTEPDS